MSVTDDATPLSDTETVTVTITGTNDAPTFDENNPVFNEAVLNNADSASTVDTADMDNDGDLDIITGAAGTDPIQWHENDGNGVFTNSSFGVQVS